MTNRQIIDQFEKTWWYNRKVTMDFLEAVPDSKWNYTHQPKYAPLSKQFRHVACVYGVYIEGLKTKRSTFQRSTLTTQGLLQKKQLRAISSRKMKNLKLC